MFSATIVLMRAEDGGRKSPIASGYRPQFYFDGKDYECRRIDVVPDDLISPGEVAEVRISLSEFATAAIGERIKPGMTFELHEGAKSIAGGVVTGLGSGDGQNSHG